MGWGDPKSGTRPGRKNGTRCPGTSTRWFGRDKSRNQNGTLLACLAPTVYKPKSETIPIQYIPQYAKFVSLSIQRQNLQNILWKKKQSHSLPFAFTCTYPFSIQGKLFCKQQTVFQKWFVNKHKPSWQGCHLVYCKFVTSAVLQFPPHN